MPLIEPSAETVLVNTRIATSSIVATVTSCGEMIGSNHNRNREAARAVHGALISCAVAVPASLAESYRSDLRAAVALQKCTCSKRRWPLRLRREAQCSHRTLLRDVPSGDRDAPAGNRQDSRSE